MTEQKDSLFFFLTISVAAIIGAITGAASIFVFAPGMLSMPMPSVEGEVNIETLLAQDGAMIQVVEEVSPAVVSIVVKKDLHDFDLRMQRMAGGEELYEVGSGTGFFVSPEGLIVTNKHVVDEERAVFSVITNDGEEIEATLIDTDPFLDIALLDIEGDGYEYVRFADSDTSKPGQTVIAIGNSLSEYRNTVTKGVISGVNRRVATSFPFGRAEVIERAIQTDAAINPGNSGGPLVNLRGEVVGVNTAVSYDGNSIGFAIPINDVKQLVEDVKTSGRIIRPWLGVRYVMITEDIAEDSALDEVQGALLNGTDESPSVFEGSPADKVNLQNGDIILEVDGMPLSESFTLGHAISTKRPGDEIILRISRDGEIYNLAVNLADFDESPL